MNCFKLMRKIFAVTLFSTMCFLSFGQDMPKDSVIDSTSIQQEQLNSIIQDLYQMGIKHEGNSIIINEEVKRLLIDSVYRAYVYPVVYTWPMVALMLEERQLKIAFWHMINLYYADTIGRNTVVSFLVKFDQQFDMEKILLSTFYTYAFTDPQVSRINNSKWETFRPDIMEEKLAITKELSDYVLYFRKKKFESQRSTTESNKSINEK